MSERRDREMESVFETLGMTEEEFIEKVASGEIVHPIKVDLEKLYFYFEKFIESLRSKDKNRAEVVLLEFIALSSAFTVKAVSAYLLSMELSVDRLAMVVSEYVDTFERDLWKRVGLTKERRREK